VYVDIEDFLDGLFDCLDAGVAEFEHLAGVGHDDVVVLFVEIRLLIMRLVVSELVLAYESAIQQQFDGIVKRGAAHPIVLVLHLDIEVLDVEVLLAIVDLVQDGVALGRFAVPLVFQVFGEDVPHRFLVFAVVDGYECHSGKDTAFVCRVQGVSRSLSLSLSWQLAVDSNNAVAVRSR